MGLASSQARMLLLTARKSDLEYRAQMISQRKINLAMQTQQLATEYSRSMSNRVMSYCYYTDGNKNELMTEKLSYNGILSHNTGGEYLVANAKGQFVVGGKTQDEVTENATRVRDKLLAAGMIKKDDGTPYTTKDLENTATADIINEIASSMMTREDYVSNSDAFQSALRNGSLFLYKADIKYENNEEGQPELSKTEYNIVSWSSLDSIQDNLNTEDDAAAQAEYESKSLILSNQDKQLDLELNQIQTQHKSIETEYDSVKKVIEKNIDVSYKIFA